MITPASVSDWTLMGGLLASLGGLAAIGHRWMLREPAEERRDAEHAAELPSRRKDAA
jgi:hypothetical protein